MGISFATAVLTSVLVAPDVSGHDHFGTLYTGSSHGKSALISYPSLRLCQFSAIYILVVCGKDR